MPLNRLLPLLIVLPLLAACSGNQQSRQYDPSDPSSFRTQADEKTASELYEEARTSMQRGNYTEAATRLENLQARYPFGAYFKQAQLDLISAYYEAKEMESAINAADRFIRLNPQDPNVAYALYMRGRANLERGNDFLTRTFGIDRRLRDPSPIRESMNDFQRLIDRFPDSDYAADASERQGALRNHLAHHEVHVANFYIRRGAFVAAANRAKIVVENYQGTPAVPDALGIMAQSYDRLEMHDLKEDVLSVIRENYPDHPALQESWSFPRLGRGS